MNLEIILDEAEIPSKLLDFKVEHYKEVFGEHWEQVFNANPHMEEGEEMVIAKDSDRLIGGCIIKKGIYCIRMKGFGILPENRRRGYARELIYDLRNMTRKHHHELVRMQKKPTDIKLMYLRSLVYLDGEFSMDIPALQFGSFLKNLGFIPYMYNKHELSEEEKIAIEVYKEMYPDLADSIKVFKKTIVDYGVDLKPEIKQELLALTKEQWDTVMHGLNWKLGNYEKSGKVSFRYDLCPICADMESSEQDSENCRKCYIYKTCTEPFREIGRFKEDFQVSNAYFTAMRDFMLANKPRN